MEKSRKIVLLFYILVLFVVFILFFNFGFWDYLSLSSLQANQEWIADFVSTNYLWSVLIFVLIYTLSNSLQIPISTILTLAAGAFFGWAGVLYVNFGATMGAAFSFLLARYVLQDYFESKFASKLKVLNSKLAKNSTNYLLFVRLVPVFPFWLVNILCGLTNIKLFDFIWTTSVGIILGSSIYVYTGTELAKLESLDDILSFRTFEILTLFGILAILPTIFKKKQL